MLKYEQIILILKILFNMYLLFKTCVQQQLILH